MVTPSERQEIESMADQEKRTVSDMMRVLMLDSLKVWKASLAGRSRRKK